jgi:predicted type IV restriction endonuclease
MFNKHGDYTVTRQGNLLLVSVAGAWNAETAKAYKETINKAIELFNGKSWATISNVDQWELCTPDCELLMIQLLTECRDKNLQREAIVNRNIKSVKMDLFHKASKKDIPEPSPDVVPRRFFETDTEAKEWLNNEGYGL